jgi:Ecdysteroid kinase-like family
LRQSKLSYLVVKNSFVFTLKTIRRLLFYAKEPVPVIVLEDVNQLDYEMHNQPLNLADTKVVCAKIAKFHAASMSTVSSANFESGLFQLKSNDGLKFMQNNVGLFIDELKTWKNCEVFVQKFEKFHSNFMQKGRAVYESADAGYKVLNHGDFHHNNMMFRRKTDGSVDVLFVRQAELVKCAKRKVLNDFLRISRLIFNSALLPRQQLTFSICST